MIHYSKNGLITRKKIANVIYRRLKDDKQVSLKDLYRSLYLEGCQSYEKFSFLRYSQEAFVECKYELAKEIALAGHEQWGGEVFTRMIELSSRKI